MQVWWLLLVGLVPKLKELGPYESRAIFRCGGSAITSNFNAPLLIQ
jgi:hypothetical protein